MFSCSFTLQRPLLTPLVKHVSLYEKNKTYELYISWGIRFEVSIAYQPSMGM